MKKKPKLKKLSNKKLIESYLQAIEKNLDLHPKDVSFGDGYFVFDFGNNSVCWFHIKEIPGFLFGIWTCDNINKEYYSEANENSELVLFSQIEYAMDKFKPSRCALKCFAGRYTDVDQEAQDDPNFDHKNIDSLDWKEYWDLFETDSLLTFMKRHKSVAEQVSYHSEYGFYCYESPIRAWYHCRKDRFIYNKYKVKDFIKRKYLEFKVKNLVKKFRDVKVAIFDYGENWSPRIHVLLYEKKYI